VLRIKKLPHLNDGEIAIRDGRIYLFLKAGIMESVNVAPNDLTIGEQVLREKPVLI